MNYIFELFSTDNPGSLEFSGSQSWIYYLFGALFVVFTLVCAFFAYKYRDSKKEYEPIAHMFSSIKRFWFLNRFAFFLMTGLICAICAVVFFVMNPVLLQ